jgi:uncharacterized protein (DUF362 family)
MKMSFKDTTRRNFFKNVVKYCGAGVAALGILGLRKKSAHAVADLDELATTDAWKSRDILLDQYDEFIKNARHPEGYFTKEPEEFVNNMKPVSWRHLHPNWYDEGGRSLVSVVQATELDQDVKGDIKKAVKMIGGFGKALKKSDKILIKPNWNSADRWPFGGTDPRFLDALIQLLQEDGYSKLTIADTCGPWGPAARVIKIVGYDKVAAKNGIAIHDWDKGKWMHITNEKAVYLGRFGGGDGTVGYPEDLRNYDKIIYQPIMKTHFLGHITMALKLSVGILHRADRGGQLHAFNHLFTAQQSAEINLPTRPDLIIMDGRRALIAGGPAHGQMVKPGFILASGDQVANDVMGIRILQEWHPHEQNKITMDAWRVNQISHAVKLKIGYARNDDDIKMLI